METLDKIQSGLFDIGIDLVQTERFKDFKDKSDIRLLKMFTQNELDYCFGKNPSSKSLAGKFAAKEAVIKLFSNQGMNIGHANEIEILNDEFGRPFVKSTFLEKYKDKIKISISHEGDFALAVAIMSYRIE